MKNRIAILDTGYGSYDYELELFNRHGYTLEIYEMSVDQKIQRIEFARYATGVLVRGTVIDEMVLQKLPDLKAIVRYGVGYDNIDIKAVKARGIRVANVQGYANHAVSDHALALMFSCVRDLEGNRKGLMGVPSRKEIFELHDKTLGIIGIGRIGSQFSKKASPLFRDTLAFDPYKTVDYISSYGATKTDLPELFRKSHVISVHCNLTDETKHLLNASGFELMANRPVIINTARGPVIHETDLLNALDKDQIHSAGLDVFEQESVSGSRDLFINHPRIVATPHIAWYSDSAIKEVQKRAADNMIALLTGQQLNDEL